MCCSALEIDHFKKPAGPKCVNCRAGGVRAIYAGRPQVCRDFECEWLTLRDLSRQLRPDLVGTILMEDADSDEYRAVCAPEKPMAWRHPLVFAHLVAKAKSGRIVWRRRGLRRGGFSVRANGGRRSDRCWQKLLRGAAALRFACRDGLAGAGGAIDCPMLLTPPRYPARRHQGRWIGAADPRGEGVWPK